MYILSADLSVLSEARLIEEALNGLSTVYVDNEITVTQGSSSGSTKTFEVKMGGNRGR